MRSARFGRRGGKVKGLRGVGRGLGGGGLGWSKIGGGW